MTMTINNNNFAQSEFLCCNTRNSIIDAKVTICVFLLLEYSRNKQVWCETHNTEEEKSEKQLKEGTARSVH